ncbi:hypothetical protein ANN_19563 [Periplaneta americana]|uniref:Uncharacterized protein n=1 Tax=Periplaneta americana TaxID=6978 RepID=A0ABQ8SAV8_PERAM|nr:hypothetical protein ANN_19563 [Periplaneta americana]
MAGLCEGGNEPTSSLKAICNLPRPGFEPGPRGFAARRADPYSTSVDLWHRSEKAAEGPGRLERRFWLPTQAPSDLGIA